MNDTVPLEYDVVVVGGAPAGSTVASVVARDGHRVALVEKYRFPRYQVGESLWVATWDIFDFLGVSRAIRAAGFAEKQGGTFIWGPLARLWSVYFAEENGSVSTAYHVDRSTFDQLLLERSRTLGVDVITHTTALDLIIERDRVCGLRTVTEGDRRSLRARFVVDASGLRSTLTPNSMPNEIPRSYCSAAVWTYFRHVTTLSPPNDGNVLTVMFPYGWFWLIPLGDGRTSVGVVLSPEKLEEDIVPGGYRAERVFRRASEACEPVRGMLADAINTDRYRARLFRPRNLCSYFSDGFLAVGDAACFIDPVFSTGVHLGMSGACYAGFALNTIFGGGREDLALQAFDRYYRDDYGNYQRMTEDLYALNSDQPDEFWRARQVALPSDRQKRRDKTLAFLHTNEALHGDREAIIRRQVEYERGLHATYGTGRFRQPDFLNQRLVCAASKPQLRSGYVMGDASETRFREATLVALPGSGAKPASPPDLALFRLCDARRTVQHVIGALRATFDFDALNDMDLAELIGGWIDVGVLETAI